MRLLEIAHSLEELKTICRCGRKAMFNARLLNGEFTFDGDQVAFDGDVGHRRTGLQREADDGRAASACTGSCDSVYSAAPITAPSPGLHEDICRPPVLRRKCFKGTSTCGQQ
jgi:hypothetical protein